ncbi:MAG: hypothetical protein WA154_11115 [Moraxellaceae bacterium]
MTDNQKAAAILRQYAGELYQGHTIGGQWDEGCRIKAEHDELLALADRLALAQSGEAVCYGCSVGMRLCDDGLHRDPLGQVFPHTAAVVHTHPAPDRVAELEREQQISAALSRKVVALEQQLAESRELEGRMRGVLEAFDKAARESGSIIGFAGKAVELITHARSALAAEQEKK